MPDEKKPETATESKPEEKKRRGRPPGSGKKGRPKKGAETSGMFVLAAADVTDCEAVIVPGKDVITKIAEYAEAHELKAEEVKVFEVGKQVIVKSEITITPA